VHDAVAVNFQKALAATGGAGILGSEGSPTSKHGGGSNGIHPQPVNQRRRPLGLVGIRNLGNTCFLNASLQCLSATIPLTDYFLGYDYRSEINHQNVLGTGGKLVVEYAELMKDMWLGKNTVVKPVSFKSQLEKFAPQFRGSRQHDSQELLAYLLDGIHEDLNRIQQKPFIEDRDCDGTQDEEDAIESWKNYLRRDKSLIVDIFQGQMRSKLTCLACKHTNVRFEPFMYLSLPITASCRTIQDCLELYLEEEKMEGANQWYCSKCKEHRDATKKTDLWILPPILIVHLKRFSFDDYGQLGSKNEAPIHYPVREWDLSNFVHSRGSEHPLYDLYAVSNHVGGLGSGHYTAFAQNRFDDQWFEFNDSTYRAVDDEDKAHHRNRISAYVLFYNRSSQPGSDRRSSSTNSSSTNGHDVSSELSTTSSVRMHPLIRRQSVNRPDLWPHTQVQDSLFREFKRTSMRKLSPMPLDDDDDDDGIGGNNSKEEDADAEAEVVDPKATASATTIAEQEEKVLVEGKKQRRRLSKPSRFL